MASEPIAAAADPISAGISQIIAGMPPGTRLPAEREMAEQLAVSRVALRDRLRAFESLGILERRQGAGTFVKELDSGSLAGMLELMLAHTHLSHSDLHVVRIALERESARQAALVPDPVLDELAKCVDVFRTSKRKSQIVEADAAFHNHLMRLAGNPGLIFFADALQSTLFRSLKYRNERWSSQVRSTDLLVDLHVGIVEAILSGDPEQAAAAVDQHFGTFDRLVVRSANGRRRA